MKNILLILFCSIGMAASAQNFAWSGSITVDVNTPDTVFDWATKFRNDKIWSMGIDYESLNNTDARFAIVVSNKTAEKWVLWPTNTVTFPVTLNPVSDSPPRRSFYFDYIPFNRIGIMFIKGSVTSGHFDYDLKQ